MRIAPHRFQHRQRQQQQQHRGSSDLNTLLPILCLVVVWTIALDTTLTRTMRGVESFAPQNLILPRNQKNRRQETRRGSSEGSLRLCKEVPSLLLLLSSARSSCCSASQSTRLLLSSEPSGDNDDDKNDNTERSNSSSSSNIRFLGRGANAIVRPGVVLLAPAEEFHHYLRQSAVFVYAMGTDDNEDYVIRGVIIDNPTPFAIEEMMEEATNNDTCSGGVYENLIFRGGESGGQEAFCLHSWEGMDLEEIGTSGVYQGGDLSQIRDPSRVKFFFNYMEFLEQELEDMLDVIHEDGDGWTSVEVPPEMVLNSDYDKGDAWSKLRNAIRGQ
mmetsp:Transcript_15561/g.35676  ORF Transcript_15561/g.35676 Transcript_15561/m.35676 type:complete len:329 (-) Transcript_15561:149-1135(-)